MLTTRDHSGVQWTVGDLSWATRATRNTARDAMPALAKAAPVPRYGSVAEISSYSGLSPKTIRRMVESGRIRSYKAGRRLLIPFEELDRAIVPFEEHRRANMSQGSSAVMPERTIDARGRAIPLSDEELDRRAEAAIRALDALDDMGDEDEQRETLDALIEAIDQDRLSDRRRFG